MKENQIRCIGCEDFQEMYFDDRIHYCNKKLVGNPKWDKAYTRLLRMNYEIIGFEWLKPHKDSTIIFGPEFKEDFQPPTDCPYALEYILNES